MKPSLVTDGLSHVASKVYSEDLQTIMAFDLGPSSREQILQHRKKNPKPEHKTQPLAQMKPFKTKIRSKLTTFLVGGKNC